MTRLSRFSRTRRAALGALALGIAALPSAAGAAQISQGTWYETRSASCSATLTCSANFSAIPAGKTLVARNIGCRLTTPANALVTAFSLSGAGTSFIPVGAPQAVFSAARYYYVNTEIFSTFIAGQIPRVSFSSGVLGNLTLSCSLGGELRP